MMKTDCLIIARQKLAEKLNPYQPPVSNPLSVSPWVAMSALQKAIRRGRNEIAQRAAATLLAESPERLWRRCGGIAFEDIGVANTETVALVTAALAGKRFRATLGGEWKVASFIVKEMVQATKCRAADDLLLSAQLHPTYTPLRQTLNLKTQEELETIAVCDPSLPVKALATWYATGIFRPTTNMRFRKGSPASVFAAMKEADMPFTEIAQEGYRKVGEILCPFVSLLLSPESQEAKSFEDDTFLSEVSISDVPGWAYDTYTREGRTVYQAFLQGDTQTAQWIQEYVPQGRRVSFLGTIIFRIEGGLVRSRLKWPIGEELRRQVDMECNGPHCADASEIMSLARADIDTLNEVRCHVL
ncbi:MAG: hypothetical protein V4691_00420 [Pseudomonadota bacterium]